MILESDLFIRNYTQLTLRPFLSWRANARALAYAGMMILSMLRFSVSGQQANAVEEIAIDTVEDAPEEHKMKGFDIYKFLSKKLTIDTTRSIAWSPYFGFSVFEHYGNHPIFGIGMNFFASSQPMFVNSNVATLGTLLMVSFPFRVPYLRLSYDIKAMYHETALAGRSDTLARFYLLMHNGLTIGKTFHFRKVPFYFVPQYGIGINNGIELFDRPQNGGLKGGSVHYHFSNSFGLLTHRRFQLTNRNMGVIDIGLDLRFENAFQYNEDTERRFYIALLLSD